MTRDEQRKACIFETAKRVKKLRLAREPWMDRIAIALNCEPTGKELAEAAMWIDALHGLALVNPVDATDEMIETGRRANLDKYPNEGLYERVWRAMSAAGNLTNPQETKP